MAQFSTKEDASAYAQDLAASAKQKLQDLAGPTAEKVDVFLRESIQKRPLGTLAVVAAAGFVLGRRSRGLPWAKIAELGLSNLAFLRQ